MEKENTQKETDNKQQKKSDVSELNSGSATKIKNRKTMIIKSWLFLLIVNMILFSLSIYFIVILPKKAEELNKARSDEQRVKESQKVDITGLEYQPTQEKVEKLIKYYPEEAGVIDFIERVEGLKKLGYVKNFALVGQDAVKDKTGVYGIPFIVEFEGNWESTNVSLQELQKLPYLIRAINIEAKVIDTNLVNFKFGGFLYVSDKLAKTR